MKQTNRTNTLLIELIIVLFFFMLASTILVQIFAASRNSSRSAAYRTDALTEAQNIAESICAGAAVEDALQSGGFTVTEDHVWLAEKEGYSLTVACAEEKTAAGTLYTCEISAQKDGKTLFTLPCARYAAEGGEAE